jgi:hypothetical protein
MPDPAAPPSTTPAAPPAPSANQSDLRNLANQAAGNTPEPAPGTPAPAPGTSAPSQGIPTDILPGSTTLPGTPPAPTVDPVLDQAITDEIKKLNLGKEQSAAFRTMRLEQAQIKAERDDWEKRAKETDALKARLDPLEKLKEQVDFATSRRFREQFQAPYDAARTELINALKPFGLTDADVDQLKDADWKKRGEILKAKAPGQEALVVQLFGQHDRAYSAMKTALNDATKDGTKWRETVKTERLAKADTALTAARDRLLKANHFALNDSKADQNYLKSIMTKATEFFTDNVGDDQRAEAALKAASADVYHQLYMMKVKELDAVMKDRDSLIAGRRSAGPGGGAPPTPPNNGQRPAIDANTSLRDLASMAAGG